MSNLISHTPVPPTGLPATAPPPQPSSWFLKVVMAVTGAVLVGFVLFHMAGNLKVFLGAEEFNHYAEWLRTLFNPLLPGETFLWSFRAVMLAAFVAHIWASLVLRRRARRARGPVRRTGMPARRWPARTMLMTGAIVLCFVVFHVLDLTVGRSPAATGEFTPGDAYGNLVASLQRPAVALFYGLTMLLIAIHVSHGVWSVLNDLGVTGQRTRDLGLVVAGLIAIAIAVGNVLIPIAVQAGWVP